MRTVGLLFPPVETPASLVAGGITVLERQARQLRRAGATALFVIDVVPLTELPRGVEAISSSTVAAHIADDDRVVAIAAGLIVDERAITAMLAAPPPALLVCGSAAAEPVCIERLDAGSLFAGIMVLPGAQLLMQAAGLGEWDLASTLIRAVASDPSATRVDFRALPVYAPARRREVPLIWARPANDGEARAVGEILIAASQKGCLDWPARFLHPWPENLLVRLLAPTPITPNMVTLFTGVIGVVAGLAFAFGWLWTGLVLALITGPLDGVDGKLARTRVEFSKWGDLEHLLDKLLEYGWYLCVAGYFSVSRGSALPWAIAALIILPAIAEAVQGEFFRRLTGIQLDDAGEAERRIRLFAGRRNTFLWTWLPFAATGLWFEGFVGLAIYSVVTTGVAQWRFYKRLSAYGRAHGERIAANYVATGYTFLPKAGL
ncbi:MAG: CDP-alcohol phosphatidyltransferase family protein [Polymorphobacter sp.]